MSKEIDVRELDFLLRFNIEHSYVSSLDFLSNSAWSAIKVAAPSALLTVKKGRSMLRLLALQPLCSLCLLCR